MNPLPFVLAILKKDKLATIAFIILIALATALGVAVTAQEKALRTGSARAADAFDIIIAAPGSQTDVLLKTIFLRSGTVNLLEPKVLSELLSDNRAVYAAPLGFGDNYNGNPIVGTTADLVLNLANGKLAEGAIFRARNEAVVGINSTLKLGERIHAEHGHGAEGEDEAGDHGTEFTVVGRMAATASPWDNAIIIPIEEMWASHNLPNGHYPINNKKIGMPFEPKFLSGVPAVIVKPKTLADAYRIRSAYTTAQSTAFFPAEVLLQLYQTMGNIRVLMSFVAWGTQSLVIAAIMAGIIVLLRLQNKQFAILRALGAPRRYLLASVWLYVTIILGAGALLGLALGWLAAKLISIPIAKATGIALNPTLGMSEVYLTLGIIIAGLILALIPAYGIYRQSLVNALR